MSCLKDHPFWRVKGVFTLLLVMGAGIVWPTYADDKQPANLIPYTPLFTGSGQPDAAYFDEIAKQGYDVVINLAPSTSHGSLENEGHLVSSRGLVYLNIPVDWNKPSLKDFEVFYRFMLSNAGRKVFLHCQVNMRASSFAFLYRVIALKVPPDDAIHDMLGVWSPNDTWTAFMKTVLKKYQIDYQLPL